EIYAHARREHPNECCGIVYGPKAQPVAARAVACVNIQNELHAEDPVQNPRDARTAAKSRRRAQCRQRGNRQPNPCEAKVYIDSGAGSIEPPQ
ncbi:MAG: Mov34/MPN/PAD-1 family protein, partial [Mycobacteriales bacterium]